MLKPAAELHGAKAHKTKPDCFHGNETSQDRVLRKPFSKMLFRLRQVPVVEVLHSKIRPRSG